MKRLYWNPEKSLYLRLEERPELIYHRLTINLTEDDGDGIAILNWYQRTAKMTDGFYQIEIFFRYKLLIARENNRVYVGDSKQLGQSIFRLEHVQHREYRLRHNQSNKILCIYQQSLNLEAPLARDSHSDQTFIFERVDYNTIEYYIWPTHQRSTRRNKALDVHNDPPGRAGQNGSPVQLYDFHGGPNQRFRLIAVDENI
ncbi:unnamed protein product [Rotaria socialis]|uniref:Ricin B lectin domain-containing protein n=2 Tax=Rotaria socialis TaxID=392032 RepID=A0A820ZTT6_9BILA|nr:unnamed protein product [Rotaria socialis]